MSRITTYNNIDYKYGYYIFKIFYFESAVILFLGRMSYEICVIHMKITNTLEH